MRVLLDAIEANKNRFERKPLGPLGSLLTLTDDKWAVAVEASVGRTFNNFIVHSSHDAQLFKVNVWRRPGRGARPAKARRERWTRVQSLVRGIPGCPVPPHIIYSFDHARYDLDRSHRRQVPAEFTTVFRVLKVEDVGFSHTVSNVLNDHCSAERLLLVEVRREVVKEEGRTFLLVPGGRRATSRARCRTRTRARQPSGAACRGRGSFRRRGTAQAGTGSAAGGTRPASPSPKATASTPACASACPPSPRRCTTWPVAAGH